MTAQGHEVGRADPSGGMDLGQIGPLTVPLQPPLPLTSCGRQERWPHSGEEALHLAWAALWSYLVLVVWMRVSWPQGPESGRDVPAPCQRQRRVSYLGQ